MNVLRYCPGGGSYVCARAARVRLASAEIVFMTSGGTLSVKGHKKIGDSVILTLRSGGEVTCDKTLIERIVPDEVPHPEPAAGAAAQEGPKVPAAVRTAGLQGQHL